MAWFYLLLSGLFEIGFTTFMKVEAWWGTALWTTFASASFFLLSLSMRTLSLGTCYAVFTGIGAVGTALVGIVFYGEPASPSRLSLLSLIVAIVIGLKLVSPASRASAAAPEADSP